MLLTLIMTFDGGGHTITLAIGSAESPFGEEYAALFRNVTTAKANPSDAADSPASIHSLVVDGHIYTNQKYAASIVGNQYGTVSIDNCHVSTIIHSSKSGDDTNRDVTFTGGAFKGTYAHISWTEETPSILFMGQGTSCTGRSAGPASAPAEPTSSWPMALKPASSN